MWANQSFNKFADFAGADGFMKTFINFLIYGYGQFFCIGVLLYCTYSIRVMKCYVNNSGALVELWSRGTLFPLTIHFAPHIPSDSIRLSPRSSAPGWVRAGAASLPRLDAISPLRVDGDHRLSPRPAGDRRLHLLERPPRTLVARAADHILEFRRLKGPSGPQQESHRHF